MIDLLYVALLAAHLILLNVAMAGPLAAVLLVWRFKSQDDALADRVARSIALSSLSCFTGAIVLGGLLILLILANGADRYFDAFLLLPRSRLWFAAAELAFYLACIVAYVALWKWRLRRAKTHHAIAIVAATNLMVHFPPLFTIVALLASGRFNNAQSQGTAIDRAGFQRLLLEPEVLAKVAHVWLAAIAATAVLCAWYALRERPLPPNAAGTADAWPIVAACGRFAFVVTVLQFLVGGAVLATLPPNARGLLLGDDYFGTALFGLSFFLALHLLRSLGLLALGERAPKLVNSSALTMLLIIILMTGVLHRGQTSLRARAARAVEAH